MVFRYEHGLGVVREVSVSWNWRISTGIVFGKHWSVFGCGLGGVCQREVILKCFLVFVIFAIAHSREQKPGCGFGFLSKNQKPGFFVVFGF